MTVKQVKTVFNLLKEENEVKVEFKAEDGQFYETEVIGVRMDDGVPVMLTYRDNKE